MVEQTASKTFAQAEGVAEFGQFIGQVADEVLDVGLTEQRRELADNDAAVAEGFKDKAKVGEFGRAGDQSRGGGFVQLDDFGDQQSLALHPAIDQRRLDTLVDQPFVGGVLIDDHDAVGCLGYDVRVVDLRPRGP